MPSRAPKDAAVAQNQSPESVELVAYVARNSPGSQSALTRLRAFCEEHFGERCGVEIVDVTEQPQRVLADGVLVTPTVVRRLPLPEVRLIGDLSDKDALKRLVPGEEW